MKVRKHILILEDDLLTLSKLLFQLSRIEEESGLDFNLIVLSDYTQVEKYINSDPQAKFDLILLDRDCNLGGSFHILDLERLGPEKVIAISSIPQYNEQARKRGVKSVVLKNYDDLDTFAELVAQEIRKHLEFVILN